MLLLLSLLSMRSLLLPVLWCLMPSLLLLQLPFSLARTIWQYTLLRMACVSMTDEQMQKRVSLRGCQS
jgi:hypothetical protein